MLSEAVENGSFVDGCEDGEKFAVVFCTHRERLPRGFQVQMVL